MTLFGVAVAIAAIILLTARESRVAGGAKASQGPAEERGRLRLPHWVDAALVVVALGVLLPTLWELST